MRRFRALTAPQMGRPINAAAQQIKKIPMVTSSPDTPNKSQKEGLVTTVVGITVPGNAAPKRYSLSDFAWSVYQRYTTRF